MVGLRSYSSLKLANIRGFMCFAVVRLLSAICFRISYSVQVFLHLESSALIVLDNHSNSHLYRNA